VVRSGRPGSVIGAAGQNAAVHILTDLDIAR
jgi:hypothetical protein